MDIPSRHEGASSSRYHSFRLRAWVYWAETMSFADLDKSGSVQAVKEAGRYRSEGKEYEVQDGDIIEFRFKC